MTKTTIRLALLAALTGGSLIAAHADRAITVSTKPFDAALPIAPAKLPASAAPARSVAPVVAAAPVHAPVVYDVSLRDKTSREALARWAKASGWVHDPVHWALDRDLPIAAAAGPEIFGPDFKHAVRILLSSTELTDRPAQPCFYTNRVVRVIPKAEFCDKTAD